MKKPKPVRKAKTLMGLIAMWPFRKKPEFAPEIDYNKCRACGGTGWAYAATVYPNGDIVPGTGGYVRCPCKTEAAP